MKKLILAAILVALLIGGLMIDAFLWLTPLGEPGAAVSPPFRTEYREDTAHYIDEVGKPIP